MYNAILSYLITPFFMSSLLRHMSAMQFSAAALVTTVAVSALPLLAADQYDDTYYGNQIVQLFQKIGAESVGSYNNGSLETSAFDFASFFSHTCYRPTDFDMPGCKEKFGPYANLKTTYDSGRLAAIFSRVSYLADITKLLPGSYGAKPTESSASSSSSALSTSSVSSVSSLSSSSSSSFSADLMDRTDRASMVWKLCVKKFSDRNQSVACYQRNIRLIMDRVEAVDANLIY